MAKIAKNILERVGGTPLVELSDRLNKGGARVLVKVESFNPGGSVKDRIAVAMVEAAEEAGTLKPGATIIEPTSGNTGVGLALVSAVKGYHLILTMPETMSVERRKLAAAYGAEIVLTPGSEGMKGAIAKANELRDATPGAVILQQFENPANPARHNVTTGPEIWADTDGQVDAFVAGVGTGGTLSGAGRFLKAQKADVKVFAVEPDTSPVLSQGKAGPHKIQGIGANFIPKNLDLSVVDSVETVPGDEAVAMAARIGKDEGILCGISSAAAAIGAIKYAQKMGDKTKAIVAIFPDSAERYLSGGIIDAEMAKRINEAKAGDIL